MAAERPAPDVAALLAAAGLDARDGVQIVSAHRLAATPFDPSVALVVLRAARPDAAPLPGRHARHGPAAALSALYPPAHRARRLRDAGEVRVADLDDGAIRAEDWFLPSLMPLDNLASPHGMAAISARLRAPDGCPWDRRQTHESLRTYLLEEAYETVDAIERGTAADLAEELGDVLLQVVLHAQFAAEAGEFDLTDVYRKLATKIVRRHPHVFGDQAVSGIDQVVANWEAIKAAEREEQVNADPLARSSFGGVARALPALPASREIQDRASALGWDWDSVAGVWDKVDEEMGELREAATREERQHELGDVLFALVNLGRWLEVDPEAALRAANRRWVERYDRVERLAAERSLDLSGLSLAEKDRLWDEVKGR